MTVGTLLARHVGGISQLQPEQMPYLQKLETGKCCDTYRATQFLYLEKIVSWCNDGEVLIRESELSDSPAHVHSGKNNGVSGAAINGDGGYIFSLSQEIWDTSRGIEAEVGPGNGCLSCSDVCNDSSKIALGFRNGRVQVCAGVSKDVLFEGNGAHQTQMSQVSFSP